MAGSSGNNPLAQALDRRIRAVVEPLLRDAVRRIQEEIATQLSGGTVAVSRGRVGRPPKGKPGRKPSAGTGALCNVSGCPNPHRSRGYCAAHYQAARKYKWPMPAPKSFNPPARPPRGRPAKKK
jgi:hypothetical protein